MNDQLKSKQVALAKVVAVWGSLLMLAMAKPAFADAEEWLMRINDAAKTSSFSGVFVYSHDNKIEAMEVVRRIQNGLMQERLFALNGEAREIIRDENRVWCYIPDKNVGVHDYRQVSESGFPRMLPGDINALKSHYRFSLGKLERIANRIAQEIKVMPFDTYRYGYGLWSDVQTGLLLRSDLIDMDKGIIEQYQFIQVAINEPITDQELEAITVKEDLQWFGNFDNKTHETPDTSNWSITSLPQGFQLSRHIRRMSPMDESETEHMVYTDGLSSVSLFIKTNKSQQSGLEGLSKMGAVHAFRSTINNHRITVMGEVPAATVKLIADHVTYVE